APPGIIRYHALVLEKSRPAVEAVPPFDPVQGKEERLKGDVGPKDLGELTAVVERVERRKRRAAQEAPREIERDAQPCSAPGRRRLAVPPPVLSAHVEPPAEPASVGQAVDPRYRVLVGRVLGGQLEELIQPAKADALEGGPGAGNPHQLELRPQDQPGESQSAHGSVEEL